MRRFECLFRAKQEKPNLVNKKEHFVFKKAEDIFGMGSSKDGF